MAHALCGARAAHLSVVLGAHLTSRATLCTPPLARPEAKASSCAQRVREGHHAFDRARNSSSLLVLVCAANERQQFGAIGGLLVGGVVELCRGEDTALAHASFRVDNEPLGRWIDERDRERRKRPRPAQRELALLLLVSRWGANCPVRTG